MLSDEGVDTSMTDVTERELRRQKDQVTESVYEEGTPLFWSRRPEHGDGDRCLDMSFYAWRTKAEEVGRERSKGGC